MHGQARKRDRLDDEEVLEHILRGRRSYLRRKTARLMLDSGGSDIEDIAPVALPSDPRRGPRQSINRPRQEAMSRLLADYFVENPVYTAREFRRRFRMPKELFLSIVERVERSDDYFKQKRDAVGRIGFSALHKCTAAMRLLAYGGAADQVRETPVLADASTLLTFRSVG